MGLLKNRLTARQKQGQGLPDDEGAYRACPAFTAAHIREGAGQSTLAPRVHVGAASIGAAPYRRRVRSRRDVPWRQRS